MRVRGKKPRIASVVWIENYCRRKIQTGVWIFEVARPPVYAEADFEAFLAFVALAALLAVT